MPASIDINIGTFDLNSTNEIAIADIDHKVSRSLKSSQLIKNHGSVAAISKRKEIVVKVKGTVIGSDYDDLRTNLDSLKAAIENSSEQKFTFDDDRFIWVQLKDFSWAYENPRTFAVFSFSLLCVDPFFYSQTLNSDSDVRTPASAFTITNNGNAPTRAKITVTAGVDAINDDLLITNETNGESFQYRGNIAASDSLVVNNKVDQSDLTVENDSEDDVVNYEGDFITLEPGSNSIVLTSSITTMTIKVEHRDAWY